MSRFVGATECDECGTGSFSSRANLADDGWYFAEPDFDLCPNCARKRNPLTGFRFDGETPDPTVGVACDYEAPTVVPGDHGNDRGVFGQSVCPKCAGTNVLTVGHAHRAD